ncbi:MAG: N-acetyltransferase O1 (Establishment of cohesion protein 1) [Pleopsidium flavum]|nr:MAG: N-acetyltransferase O1 (Establishment of cohesion protein 1) [Pleopsidium flavum]
MPYVISNSFKKGITKTYSRPQKRVFGSDNAILPRKRIRMDDTGVVVEEYTGFAVDEEEPSSTAPSSSPPYNHATFSSDAPDEGNESPPSSPPPARLPSPVVKARKPAFSFLMRKRAASSNRSSSSASAPLEDITNTARERGRALKKPRLTQMQIDLGGEVRTACKTCGMEYIPSNAQDAALHKEFHTASVGGVDVSKAFLKRHAPRIVQDSSRDAARPSGRVKGFVMVIDRKSSTAQKNRARRVLSVVNTELSAVEIEDNRLWSQVAVPNASDMAKDCSDCTVVAGDRVEKSRWDRFRVYLFISGEKCVGLCLAERISKAYKVKDQNCEAEGHEPNPAVSKSSSISVSQEADPAILGISRVWTSVSHRRKGLAASLLDAVRCNFIYGMHISKDMVAFSQPTESGGQLAQKWFGDAKNWHVYVES